MAYVVSVIGSDGKWWSIEDSCGRLDAIAIAANARAHGDKVKIDRLCDGHPVGPYDGLPGATEFCDGSCLPLAE